MAWTGTIFREKGRAPVSTTFLVVNLIACLALLIISATNLVRDLLDIGPHRSDNKRLRNELGWYADPDQWRNRSPDLTGTSPATRDAGARARVALAFDDDHPQHWGPGFIAAYQEQSK